MTGRLRGLALVGGLAVAAGVLAAAAAGLRSWSRETVAPAVPTTIVERGTLRLDVHLTGELSAERSVSLMPPPTGSSLRLLLLAATGTPVHAGDVVMELDPVDQLHELEQSRSQLLEAEQQIAKMQAETAAEAAQAAVDRLTAAFDVRRAEMDARAGADLIGQVEARKRELAVDEARRHLDELNASTTSRTETTRAGLASLDETRNRARATAARAQQIIDQLRVRTPIDGIVVVRQNRDTTSVFFYGMTLPDYQVGDAVLPGRLVLDVVQPGKVEIRATISEPDRPNLAVGQPALVSVDALGGASRSAHVASVGGLSSRNAFGPTSAIRRFETTLALDEPDDRLRPGTSVHVTVEGRSLPDVLTLPRQAVFTRNGEPTVYVRGASGFMPQAVTILGASENRMAVEGADEGVEVALVDPTKAPTR